MPWADSIEDAEPSSHGDEKHKDRLHTEAIKRVELLRGIYPDRAGYGSQGYGHRILFSLDHDSTTKTSIKPSGIPPHWAVRLNSICDALFEQRLRPDDWQQYLSELWSIREAIASTMRELRRALIAHFKDKHKRKRLADRLNLANWTSLQQSINQAPSLPRRAVGEWGFVSELRQEDGRQKNPSNLQRGFALSPYRRFLRYRSELFRVLGNFLEQSQPYFYIQCAEGESDAQLSRALIEAKLGELGGNLATPHLTQLHLTEANSALIGFQREFRQLFSARMRVATLDHQDRLESQSFREVTALWSAYLEQPTAPPLATSKRLDPDTIIPSHPRNSIRAPETAHSERGNTCWPLANAVRAGRSRSFNNLEEIVMWLVSLLLLSIAFIVLATARLKMHPFLALLIAAFGFGILSGMPFNEVVDSVNQGFGGTIGYIGIVILAGAIIGTFLERSGGAYRLAISILKLTGQRQVPAAMAGMGYIVSIPVFCDSAFVLLSPLMRALASKAGITLASAAVALSLGLYATHTMVPPTPGPVAAAGILGADIGLVILWGMAVGLVSLVAGWLFAVLVASRTYIAPEGGPVVDTDREEIADQADPNSETEIPSVLHALLPISLPIALIVARSIAELPSRPFGDGGTTVELLGFLGQPIVALLIGVAFAMTLPKQLNQQMLSMTGWVGEAIVGAATIIVITGAGGAFGKVLQNSGIAEVIGDALSGAHLGVWLPFIIAASIKTAQGSSTVAIITTAGLVAPLLSSLGLDGEVQRALTVVAIGAGAMVVSHANDSYFWVVTQFSGMDVQTGYRLQTLGTLVQGTAAACAVYLVTLAAL